MIELKRAADRAISAIPISSAPVATRCRSMRRTARHYRARDAAADIRAGNRAKEATPRISGRRPRGNAVSNTTTLNFSYGSGLVAEGTGVLLNNELDDFTARPGANAYGLVGFNANRRAGSARCRR
jgi:gamma-glutamyltranspeptidase/glutathione hydrolase